VSPAEAEGFAPDPDEELNLASKVLTGLGARIRAARERSDMTQQALAEMLGTTQTAVSYWEAGRRDPGVTGLLRLAGALSADPAALLPGYPEDPEPSLPEGVYGRVELPGYRNHTGWVTEETRFGVQMAVVRDWDGAVAAEVAPGPLCQFVHLPTPLKRPEVQERAAIAAPAGPVRECGCSDTEICDQCDPDIGDPF
jgi:transcriptional regulator with XRE-family HTH domain